MAEVSVVDYPEEATISVDDVLAKAGEYLPADRLSLIEDAYRFAAEAHSGQRRDSGDPYIQHPLHAALTIASLQLDTDSIAAALLHDVQEDCGVKPSVIAGRFGADVARLVEGATKLSQLEARAVTGGGAVPTLQAENLRKMFLAMAEDVRVVIVKLADRLHNMRTLDFKPPDKRRRTAQETMEIYAPLASRLGIWQLKWELEDLSFRHLEPERYREIASLVASKRTTREQYVAQVETILREELERHGIEAEVTGRAKHIYSIYQKMDKYAEQGKTFSEIYDLLALRVLVDTVAECYNALGAVHGLWHPLPNQFDDYIANPKESLYQSLHTTVMCLGARPLEVQIRTHEMHRLAEYGVAAHWRYKEGGRRDVRFEERMAWLRQLLESQRDFSHADEFVESVKTDLFHDQVFVYTPKGEIKDLPAGATPIDFAYRIHTDLGHHCVGAKVNGRLVALNTPLQNGDIVQIVTTKVQRGPSRDWLNQNLGYVKTSHAREKLRQWFRRSERAENVDKGREALEHELRRLGMTLSDRQDAIVRLFHYETMDDLLAAVGYGGVNSQQIGLRLASLVQAEEQPAPLPRQGDLRRPDVAAGVQVLGTGDLLTQIARCCNPVPGDAIIGFVTRSRGVSVHRVDCPNVLHEDEPERLIQVSWGPQSQSYPVAVLVEAMDRVGLLRDIGQMMADERVNMTGLRTNERTDGTTTVFATLETTGIEQLTRLLNKLETVRGVTSA
ncbi:MAG TPA: bifunctional (p)ppGpp synthetase/guanosine-3',5'-bis(diphosphate) 3'-pyrophosphohydrolase, partial [Dehalococcoidia bacterium]|nr:bifunctional (p)ppGpp synthetase/guanosine-3',5'-bis(diphosphate) 3'-pyrophosphohydrolase [Dehalococcoidia bacterium]